MALVNQIIHSSAVDGPGNRAAVFLQGCNFSCAYCHNSETIRRCVSCGTCVERCPAGALRMQAGTVAWDETRCCGCDCCIHVCPNLASPKTKNYTPQQVMDLLEADLPFIRGITTSGGECSLQRDFVLELFQLAKARRLSTLMDSNGSYDFARDPALLQDCDGVMLDVKAFDREAHIRLTGADNALVLKNAVFLAKAGKLEEIRTVIVPEQLPNEDTVARITSLLRPYLAVRPIRYKLIAYRSFGVRAPYQTQFRSPSGAQMQACREIALRNGFEDVVLI